MIVCRNPLFNVFDKIIPYVAQLTRSLRNLTRSQTFRRHLRAQAYAELTQPYALLRVSDMTFFFLFC